MLLINCAYFPYTLTREFYKVSVSLCFQLGESRIANGDVKQGVTDVAQAVVVAAEPQSLLAVLQPMLPPPIFALVLKHVKIISKVSSFLLFPIILNYFSILYNFLKCTHYLLNKMHEENTALFQRDSVQQLQLISLTISLS